MGGLAGCDIGINQLKGMFKNTIINRKKKVTRSSSCQDLILSSKDTSSSICSSLSFKSADDLPASVAECFQDTSFIGRLQNRLLIFLGRGSRYKLNPKEKNSFFGSNKKEEVVQRQMITTSGESISSSSQSTKFGKKNIQLAPYTSGIRPKASSTPVGRKQKKDSESSQGSIVNSSIIMQSVISTEEENLLKQYLSLQQLAIARRHCAQLRRIRDSLSSKARARRPTVVPSPEQVEMRNFLMDVGFVQYYVHLNRHGYDLATASHMDVFDLAAVGINEPLHRMAIKYELDQICRPILPAKEIPENISDWLDILGLSEYTEHFQSKGFYCPLAAVALTKRDLQFMGIYMNGHRKKLILALTALKLSLISKDYTRSSKVS